jgi:hypothetical protein
MLIFLTAALLTTALFANTGSAIANEKSSKIIPTVNLVAKLELETLPDRGIPISGCTCSISDRQNRVIFISECGSGDAFIKIAGRTIKLNQRQQTKLDPYYRAKDILIDIKYGKATRGDGYETVNYDHIKFNLVYKGQKLNIPAHGNCSS